MKPSYTCHTPAKINWFLHITGQRSDGYHNLSTLFQFVDLFDSLTFYPSENSHQIILTGCLSGVPLEKNLIYRAARALQTQAKHAKPMGVTIKVEKNIPQGAGLGGGSSDAAATLLMLNQIWQLHLPLSQLAQIGAKLGADVPVFVQGQTAFARGIGEQLEKFEYPKQHLLLAIPENCSISTPSMFAQANLKRDSDCILPNDYSFATSHNDFEPIARALYPPVAKTLDWLVEYAPSRLTGTGACCFAVCKNRQEAQQIAATAPSGITTHVVQTLPSSPVHNVLMEEFSSLTERHYG